MQMKKITFNAPLNHKAYSYEPMQIEVEKIIPLYGKRFEQMRAHPLEDAPEIIDMQAERYNSNPVPYRYNVTTVITVTSNKVDLVRGLISEQSELLKQGIAITGGDYRYNIQYDYTSLNEIKPQMIDEATKNAREAAQKFAKDSDSELGKIRRAYQGQFSIENRDANTPYIKRIRVVTTIDYSLED